MDNQVIVHFHSKYHNYFELSVWQWRDHEMGRDTAFQHFDSFGAVAHLNYPAYFFLSKVYVMIKNHDWSIKSQEFHINRDVGIPKTEVWIVDGDDTLYYSRQAALTSHHFSRRQPHAFDMAVNSRAFDQKWGFDGWLGAHYTAEETHFRLWAPTAQRVELILYASADDKASVARVLPMERGDSYSPENHKENTHGLWETQVAEDLNYHAYRYRVHYRRRAFKDTRDPYSIATTANGRRSVILSPEARTPQDFQVQQGTEAIWRLDNPSSAVIYEMHVRDFSKSVTSGVHPNNRGKFKGAYEQGTKNAYGDSSAFDYIKNLGISHIQLQPVFDHHQIIEADGSYAYNWGYDPENYNVPEASFSSNPTEPATRIHELKNLIKAYHEAGIGVIMDVVYNHTYSSYNSAFQLAVPDYYYRMNRDGSFQNGSGCGNETASEKEMFRKYMVDSVLYWVTEYGVDGFRFDLMGLHDIETLKAIREALDTIDPRIMMYGEGWDMGQGIPAEDKAKKDNAPQLPRVGFFNDDQRNAVKGAEIYGSFEAGFVSGASTEDKVAKAILGSDELVPYLSPAQVVNYVEAHDNYNLNDLLLELHPDDDFEAHIKRVELATAMNLLMQGIAFMQLGQEFLRTKRYPTGENGTLTDADKKRAMNSYNAPDRVNQVDWNNVTIHKETVHFVQQLIVLKRYHPLLSISSYEEIRQQVYVETAIQGSGFISYTIEKNKQKIKVLFNASGKNLEISMTNHEQYDILVSNKKRFHENLLTIEDLTAVVFDIQKESKF
ncbi:type I pullulanase [Streptococcus dentiloxodontae]